MAQLTHTPVTTVLQSLEQMSQTKEERLRALARERAVWDYNTEIQVAEERGEQRGLEKGIQKGREEGREEGMKIFLYDRNKVWPAIARLGFVAVTDSNTRTITAMGRVVSAGTTLRRHF